MDKEHILLLGATGLTGLEFIRYYTTLSPTTVPYLTLYVRNKSKLFPTCPESHPRIRIREGSLTDRSAIDKALSPPPSFPGVTTVISVLGAYISLKFIFTRNTTHPIGDAFASTILAAMADAKVHRILALSTPTAFPLPGESQNMSWAWWLYCCVPAVMAPQGNAEMKAIAENIVRAASKEDSLKWTIFRVPYLSTDSAVLEVRAGELGRDGFTENKSLSRASLARWIWGEIESSKWIGGAPMLANV